MKTEKQAVLIAAPGGIPAFRYGEHRGVFLNLSLDVEMDDVTYHLHSSFADKSEMGEVIDTIEFERSQRKGA